MNRNQQIVSSFRDQVKEHWPTPSVRDTYIFLVSEVGEVGSDLLRRGYCDFNYARNNLKDPFLEAELGDVFLMLITLANLLDIDLTEALEDTLRRNYDEHFSRPFDQTEAA